MTFLDLFAGIGGFRRGLELAGHQCIGFCEFDKFAAASYTSMHLITEEQREKLAGMPLKQRQTEILKEEYRNGEWYAADIRDIRAADMPKADCWCFGFPCQDISVAGKQAGFGGKRSSLFFTVTGLIRDLEKEDRPSCLLIENVKNLLSVNRGFDFARLLIELDEIGYDAQWQVVNSACYVPQNRERVFLVGSLRGRSTAEIFPLERTSGKNNILQVGMKKSRRYNPNTYRVYDISGISPTVGTTQGGLRMPLWVTEKGVRKSTPKEYFRLQGWTDDYFERAAFVSSDSQLYKQAGNGVTVPVIQEIGERMK